MSDGPEVTAETEEMEPGAEMRPCAYCGARIHPLSTRCPECGGHVALAWKTVHKEHFLFLFTSILTVIGVLASWSGRHPDLPTAFTNGMTTLRGPIILGLAVYGIFVAVFNILNRRMVMWPFLINCMLCLWVGISGIGAAAESPAWEAWTKKYANLSMLSLDHIMGQFRAIAPGMFVLTLAGVLIAISFLKGIVAGFASGAAKGREKREAEEAEAARRRASRKKDRDASAPPAGDATTTPPPGGEPPKPTI
jgi:hypothetical protein